MAQTATVAVVRANAIWTSGAEAKTHYGCDLVIEDGIVASVEEEYKGHVDIEIDATGYLVVPGLVNCHTNVGCTPHARGVSEDLDIPDAGAFYRSLIPILGLAYTELSHKEFAAIMEWDVLAVLLGGATIIVEENFGGADISMQLVKRLGIRSNLGLTYTSNVAADLTAGIKLHDEQYGQYGDRLRIHLSPQAPLQHFLNHVANELKLVPSIRRIDLPHHTMSDSSQLLTAFHFHLSWYYPIPHSLFCQDFQSARSAYESPHDG